MSFLRSAVLIFVALAIPGGLAHGQSYDDAAWRRAQAAQAAAFQQEIAAVRAIYQEVNRDAAARRLVARDTVPRCVDGLHHLVAATLWADPSGRVRLLKTGGVTEHHGDVRHYYYDRSGQLRFVYVARAAVDDSEEQERIYYAADGRRLQHLTTLTRGPGYPFHEDYPVSDPAEWLRQPCRRAPSTE